MSDLTKTFPNFRQARGYREWLSKWYPARQFETVLKGDRYVVRQVEG